MNDLIETVRAALVPGADPATKARAASIVRGVLAMLEAGVTASVSPGDTASEVKPPASTRSDDVTTIAASAPPDAISTVLDALLERLRVYVPEGEIEALPRFRVPMIRVPR